MIRNTHLEAVGLFEYRWQIFYYMYPGRWWKYYYYYMYPSLLLLLLLLIIIIIIIIIAGFYSCYRFYFLHMLD